MGCANACFASAARKVGALDFGGRSYRKLRTDLALDSGEITFVHEAAAARPVHHTQVTAVVHVAKPRTIESGTGIGAPTLTTVARTSVMPIASVTHANRRSAGRWSSSASEAHTTASALYIALGSNVRATDIVTLGAGVTLCKRRRASIASQTTRVMTESARASAARGVQPDANDQTPGTIGSTSNA